MPCAFYRYWHKIYTLKGSKAKLEIQRALSTIAGSKTKIRFWDYFVKVKHKKIF